MQFDVASSWQNRHTETLTKVPRLVVGDMRKIVKELRWQLHVCKSGHRVPRQINSIQLDMSQIEQPAWQLKTVFQTLLDEQELEVRSRSRRPSIDNPRLTGRRSAAAVTPSASALAWAARAARDSRQGQQPPHSAAQQTMPHMCQVQAQAFRHHLGLCRPAWLIRRPDVRRRTQWQRRRAVRVPDAVRQRRLQLRVRRLQHQARALGERAGQLDPGRLSSCRCLALCA